MQVKIIASNIVSEYLPSPVIGEVREIRDDVARHLMEVGAVVQMKVERPPDVKKSPASDASSSSEADRVSPETTAAASKPRKSKR